MAMDAFVPLTSDGGRGNDGAGAKPSGRTARPVRPMLRAVVRMAAEEAAQPVRWLRKGRLAVEKMTEDRKFGFCSNNRGDNLSERVNNRIGGGESGTSELCPRRRGMFEVRRSLSQ